MTDLPAARSLITELDPALRKCLQLARRLHLIDEPCFRHTRDLSQAHYK